jgi:SHS2 domain-containing protein
MNNPRYRFEIVEELASADFIFDAFGLTLPDLFIACAEACFAAMTNLEKVTPSEEEDILVFGDDLNELLYNFISELVYLKDVEKMFFSQFEVTLADDQKSVRAIARGERISYKKHDIKTDVKAVTHHELNIVRRNDYFVTRMILDL